MAYSAEISRTNPACIILLVDQSESMAQTVGTGPSRTKAVAVADAVNDLLYDLSVRCAKPGFVDNYFHVALIGYGRTVGSAYGGALAGRDLVPLSELAENFLEKRKMTISETTTSGDVTQRPVSLPSWLKPAADGGTPMNRALKHAEYLVAQWVDSYPGSFPPIVLNLTDGESTDGDPVSAASAIVSHATADGMALLFNLHMSASKDAPAMFPDDIESLPNEHSRLLFRTSSILPSPMRIYAEQEGLRVSDRTRGFVYNATINALAKFLEIGTRATDLR
ncbi:vWA domain-containing protein [Nocardia sp. NBC_01327]|uniref:vWA domain-containing protein n=1 Tax=Nocardia sp. NBC_01327 TaxID=2903593 RepID=UPI002E119A7D|nr:VWA domain-containing protein [Nocardia sp. NBC_01327]